MLGMAPFVWKGSKFSKFFLSYHVKIEEMKSLVSSQGQPAAK